MKNKKFKILFLSLAIVLGCEQRIMPEKSGFRIAKDYTDFAHEMENNDTLNIGVNLSMCMWEEFDRIEITKMNDSVYLQIKEKLVMNDAPTRFPKVLYELKNDTLNLERMMSDFDINYTEKISSPFFIITNPKEKDTILLRSIGLGTLGVKIDRYLRLMSELYPKEMEKRRIKYFGPPELIEEIMETE
ncbi:hypothetical protein OOZ15_17970 [Galbibacter sp. EGI 63066]|uniref:hypothetical protein n=1 Tax=Galbibacter sp. EGI 63066 TaxID=2993559 RepID=UPI002248F7B1|nr:hypothetical protein [Galbibacter sp. EGI 63066]MCX2681847.1 hypothetical protein [Galbibacter sp. EGI 63066]